MEGDAVKQKNMHTNSKQMIGGSQYKLKCFVLRGDEGKKRKEFELTEM